MRSQQSRFLRNIICVFWHSRNTGHQPAAAGHVHIIPHSGRQPAGAMSAKCQYPTSIYRFIASSAGESGRSNVWQASTPYVPKFLDVLLRHPESQHTTLEQERIFRRRQQ